jgi:hypothetical protein
MILCTMASNSSISAHDDKDDHTADLEVLSTHQHVQQPGVLLLLLLLHQDGGETQNDEQDGILPIMPMMDNPRLRTLRIRSSRSLWRDDFSLHDAELKGEDITVRTVMEAISLLRDSTDEQQAISPHRRRRQTRTTQSLEVLHEDYELKTKSLEFDEEESLASIALYEESYLEAKRDFDELGEALNRQQLRLFERQADILSLRMKIVNTMMEFESTSKLIKDSVSRIGAKTIEQRLNSSWPNMSKLGIDNTEEEDWKVHTTSWREIASSSPDASISMVEDGLDFEPDSPLINEDGHLIEPAELVPRNESLRLTHDQRNTEPTGGKILLTSDRYCDVSQLLKGLGKLPYSSREG